jgi:hypothetical protein
MNIENAKICQDYFLRDRSQHLISFMILDFLQGDVCLIYGFSIAQLAP